MSDPNKSEIQEMRDAWQDVAKEIHGLTIELRQDRKETAELRDEISDMRKDITQLQINQALLKDLKAAIGKAIYIIGGGFVSLTVAGIIAVIKLSGGIG